MTLERTNISPAAAGSLLLHLLVVAAMLISWPWARDLKVGNVVPVNIVSNAPSTDLRPAEQAPQEQTAQTEAPVPDAPVQDVTPEPTPDPVPTPAPPTPKAAPTPRPAPPQPAPKPAAKTPAPQKAAPAQKTAKPSELDFDALLASVSKSSKGGRQSSAEKGANRPETARQARPDLGKGLAASALAGLADELQRRWNPNCDVEGGRDVQIRTTFTLGISGNVLGDVRSEVRGPATPVAQAAAERATRAVYAAAPFKNLPPELYGQRVGVNFNAREACS